MAADRRVLLALVAGALILSLVMGVRQTFGLFLSPMTIDLGVGREVFALAIAIQNLLWGVLQPFAGMIADKFGPIRVLVAGTGVYCVGLIVMAGSGDAIDLYIGAGLLFGMALSCVSFSVVLGAVGRIVPADRRSMALGIAAAGGSFGQFIMPLIGLRLIDAQGWAGALTTMAILSIAMAPLALLLAPGARPETTAPSTSTGREQLLRHAISEAGHHRGYWYLNTGFFVCGFQVVFIAVHLPPYLGDLGFSAELGAYALMLIGFFNIVGTWACGALGDRFPKKYLLSTLYFLRAIVIALFLIAPKTEVTVLVFAACMGLLWLGTIPLTSGLVAHIFGVRYMSTLFGIVFFSHQLGSFLGVWMGGIVYDATGSYDAIWMASILLGLIAALLHLPIAERSLRPAEA